MSQSGSLVYITGPETGDVERTLVWVDREGREEALAAEPRTYIYPRVSPDGTRLALDVRDQEDDIWIWDFGRETLTRLTMLPTTPIQRGRLIDARWRSRRLARREGICSGERQTAPVPSNGSPT